MVADLKSFAKAHLRFITSGTKLDFKLICVFAVAAFFLITPVNSDAQTVSLTISGFDGKTGIVQIALYGSENDYLVHDAAIVTRRIEAPHNSDSLTVELHPGSPGEYAVAVFLDENRNDKLDTKIFGIPKEPYGFSNNPSPRFRAPRFSEAAFQLSSDVVDQTVRLK